MASLSWLIQKFSIPDSYFHYKNKNIIFYYVFLNKLQCLIVPGTKLKLKNLMKNRFLIMKNLAITISLGLIYSVIDCLNYSENTKKYCYLSNIFWYC